MNQGGLLSFFLTIVICVGHLEADCVLADIKATKILAALLGYKFFRFRQQLQYVVQFLPRHPSDLVICPPTELCTARAPEPDLLDIVQFLMMPDRHEDKVLPVIVVSVMIAVVDLQPLPLHFPIIWQKHHAHDLLYGEGLFRAVLLPFPLIWHGVQRNDFVLIRCARWNITHRTIFE